jgi:hypothetical protein
MQFAINIGSTPDTMKWHTGCGALSNNTEQPSHASSMWIPWDSAVHKAQNPSTANDHELSKLPINIFLLKVKQSLYTPWRRLGGEEV